MDFSTEMKITDFEKKIPQGAKEVQITASANFYTNIAPS